MVEDTVVVEVVVEVAMVVAEEGVETVVGVDASADANFCPIFT